MAQRSEVICPFPDQTMNEVCQSGRWDGGGVGENDQNWEEVKGQVREGCRGAGEMDGEDKTRYGPRLGHLLALCTCSNLRGQPG